MAGTFNDLLNQSEIVPGDVALLRHHTPVRGVSAATLADIWRDESAGFTLYQDTQKRNRKILGLKPQHAPYLAHHRTDIWEGAAIELASCNFLYVHPIAGWWRERTGLGRMNDKARYALVVSLETPDLDIDLHAKVEAMAKTLVGIPIEF